MEESTLEAAGNAIIYEPYETPERLAAFRAVAEAGKKNGALMIMQLSHAGRQVAAEVNPNPVSASDVQLPFKMQLIVTPSSTPWKTLQVEGTWISSTPETGTKPA